MTTVTVPSPSEITGPARTGTRETMVLNMGPHHPSTHGVLRLVVELDGEIVVNVAPDVGYLHTGVEKNMESKTYQKAVVLTDRTDYLAPLSNNLSYVLAVEKLLDCEIPVRVQTVRVLLAEQLARGHADHAAMEAEATLRRAIALDPGSARAWSALSSLLFDQGRYAEARYAARRAVNADAFLEDARDLLLTLYESALKAGPEEEARAACREGRRRFPDDANFVLCHLFVLASFPQVEPDLLVARSLLDTLLVTASARNRPMFRALGEMQLAQVAARAGMQDTAAAMIETARSRGAPPWLTYYEAHARLLLGERDRAVELLADYLDVYPDTSAVGRDWWFEDLHDHPEFRGLTGL